MNGIDVGSISGVQLALLLAIGVLTALVPLSFVWAARGEDRLRRLAWVAAFLTFDLVVFGGFTRLTDSGLGCPDWPGCFAQANPLLASPPIDAAEALLPSGPVTTTKAWIEMIHRFLALALGLIIVVMAVLAWIQRARASRSPLLATCAVALVCIQGVFGALTVTDRLQPAIVTGHLLLGMALLALLVWHAERFARGEERWMGGMPPPRRARWLAALASVVLVIQLALGGWVSTNYAVLACNDFPLCQGVWWPPMDFHDGFSLWRDLGKTIGDEYLPFGALTAIHVTHRAFAFLVALVVLMLARSLWHNARMGQLARVVTALIALQFLSGIATVVFGWPLAAAVLHNAGAAALVVTLAMLDYRLWAESLPATGPVTNFPRPGTAAHTDAHHLDYPAPR